MTAHQEIPGLDGARRQQVGAGLWAAWRAHQRGAAILTGFSGTGKSDRIVGPLVGRAKGEGIPAVRIDVPLHPTDLDQELLSLLTEELQFNSYGALADGLQRQPNFVAALAAILRQGALVVIDEFQRVLDVSTAWPIEPLGSKLRKLAVPRPDQGCLWLVSNRFVDPGWAEPFYSAELQPPEDVSDAQRIVLGGLGAAEADERFPAARRAEIVRRLGANPRVLRLLGHLLRHYTLDELLGPPGNVPQLPPDLRLIEDTERTLLSKAREGLSAGAAAALRDLSVLREPAIWEFVQAIVGHLGNVRELTRELRERYLLEIGPNRYQVHPVVREVEGPRLRLDEEAWRAAHRRAGEWYARPLFAMGEPHAGDAKIALALGGARYHLAEAQAGDVLRDAVRAVGGYIARKYDWSVPTAISAADRDARIALLEIFLEEAGPPATEYQLAKALRERAAPGDLEKALPHAERATGEQDFHSPWLLWAQLVRDVRGLEAGVAAARTAAGHVAPDKNLFSIYQFLGACLGHLGRTEEAVVAELTGGEIAKGNVSRLVEAAALCAAPEASDELLRRVRDWAGTREEVELPSVLCNLLLLERQGRWRDAAVAARHARKEHPNYMYFALHEALAWLCVSDPVSAKSAWAGFPGVLRPEPRSGTSWLAALISLHNGDLARASQLLTIHLNATAPTTADGIRAALLREWDHRVGMFGEANPALTFPILAPAITGEAGNVMRPQYGSPVLPQHGTRGPQPAATGDKRLRVLAVATEWKSGHGGLSTLNRQLCSALAAAGAEVRCVVLNTSEGERRAAQADAGVTLIEATATPGMPEEIALARKPTLPDGFVPEVIIGHGRVTGPAARALVEDHFPTAKRLHFIHMAPDEIEWFKLDREDDAGARAEERTRIELDLGRTAARVVAVGPRLYQRVLNDLHPYGAPAPIRLDPGFDAENPDPRTPPPGEPLKVLVLGRMEDSPLKGLDLAARAIGLALSRRDQSAAPIELVVRGAPEGTSETVRAAVREWAGFPLLKVVVRPYTPETERIDADIGRASLVLMPSRSEGFGLVGLEAIVAGTPVLVSDQSGLGALLRETLDQEQASRFVVRMSGDDDHDRDEWGRAVEAVLRDREAAFRRAAELRTRLGQQKTWAAATAGLLAELSGAFAKKC